MITIYKYPLYLDKEDIARVELPIESEILHVQLQNSQLHVWAMVDTEIIKTEERKIMVKGTGHEVPAHLVLKHINSFLSAGGSLVLHTFEVLS